MQQAELFSSNTPRERGLNRGVNAGNEGVARGGLRESPCEVPKRNRAGPMTTCDQEAGTPPLRGRGSRDTSKDALAEHRSSGKLGAQQQQVFAALTRSGQAFTRAELAQRTGIRLSAICGRISELLALQVITEGPRRQCGVTGKNSHVLEAR